MIAFLLRMVGGLFSWLASVLPVSPFSGMSLALGGMADALGWLNWVVPVGDMLALFLVWLAAAVIWQVVQFVLKRFDGVLGKFGGAE